MPKNLLTIISTLLLIYFIFYKSGMNQKQYEKEIDKAENQFREIIGTCYVFLKNNSTLSDKVIIAKLQDSIPKVIKEVKEAMKN